MRELAAVNNRTGYRVLHFLMKQDRDIVINHVRFFRIYRAAGLQVAKRRNRHASYLRSGASAPAVRPNERWSIDFVHDSLANGRKLRSLTLIDEFTDECLVIEIDSMLPSRRVIAALERIAQERGFPEVIKTDNGPELSSLIMRKWAAMRGIR